MFEVIESIPEEPVHFFVAPGANFKPGNIGRLVEFGDNLVVDISNGNSAFGVLGDTKTPYDEFNPKDLVRIWPQRMVFRTDEFDKEHKYAIGNPLYASETGLITSKKPWDNAQIVARLIIPPSEEKICLEALWL